MERNFFLVMNVFVELNWSSCMFYRFPSLELEPQIHFSQKTPWYFMSFFHHVYFWDHILYIGTWKFAKYLNNLLRIFLIPLCNKSHVICTVHDKNFVLKNCKPSTPYMYKTKKSFSFLNYKIIFYFYNCNSDCEFHCH